MRIAHVITRMIIGGAQENTLFTCQDLIRLFGDDVLLITGPALGPEGDLLGQGRGAEVSIELIPELRRAVRPWLDWTSYRRLKQILKTFQPDVVHTHSAKGGILGRQAAWSLHVPAIVHTVHGAPFHPYQNWLARSAIRWCERWAAQRCHALVSVADAMTDSLVQAGVAPREKFTTIYSGMDVEPFLNSDRHRESMRNSLGYRAEHVVVGKIARLFDLKGQEFVIDAARAVIAECPQVRFLFIGDGTRREQLQAQIRALGLDAYFQFAGLVPPVRIPEYLSAMDVLVHTSLREGLARALPQALIAGKPAISYDVDGAREVVISNETGFILPARSIAPLSDAIMQLARDASLRERLGRQGRERFTDTFRRETMATRLRSLYQGLLQTSIRPTG